MTTIRVPRKYKNSLLYIRNNFYTSDIDFLYENGSFLSTKFDTSILELLTKEQLFDVFEGGFMVDEPTDSNTLPDVFKVRVLNTKLLLDCVLLGSKVYVREDDGEDTTRFPYDVDKVVKLINNNTWSII